MAVLVAGGCGFIGINVVKALAERGHEVVSFDIRAGDELSRKFVVPWADSVAFVQGDVLREEDLDRAASGRKITQVVNCVTDNSVGAASSEAIHAGVEVNVMGKVSLLDFAARISVQRFLSMSSINVYGYRTQVHETVTEDVVATPDLAVSTTNLLGEQIAREYAAVNGFEAVSARISSTYGVMERDSGFKSALSVTQEWTGRAVRGEPVLVGDRSLGLQCSYATDIAAGTCALLEAPSLGHDVYNLSNPRWTTIGEMADALRELRPSLEIRDDPDVKYMRWKPRSLCPVMDVNRVFEDVGFAPRFDTRAALGDLLDWRESFPFRDYLPGR